MPEILVVDGLGQIPMVVLEGVDGAVLAVEERTVIDELGQRLSHQTANREGSVYRVCGMIDRTFLVEMGAGEFELGMPEDTFRDMPVEHHMRAEDGNRLRMRAAEPGELALANEATEFGDKGIE